MAGVPWCIWTGRIIMRPRQPRLPRRRLLRRRPKADGEQKGHTARGAGGAEAGVRKVAAKANGQPIPTRMPTQPRMSMRTRRSATSARKALQKAGAKSPKPPNRETKAGTGRKGPRRRGRRGGRRGRSGQRPQQAAGEEAQGDVRAEAPKHKEARPSGDGEGRQNGAGRQKRSEEAPPQEVQQPHHEAERVFATVTTASEKSPASSEPRVEGPAEPEAPRRRGWWQR